jgi:calcium-dependent protein kinase
LKEIIKANNLKLQDIFANFDGDKGGVLDINEFSRLIRVIAPAIKDKEIL